MSRLVSRRSDANGEPRARRIRRDIQRWSACEFGLFLMGTGTSKRYSADWRAVRDLMEVGAVGDDCKREDGLEPRHALARYHMRDVSRLNSLLDVLALYAPLSRWI